MTSALSTKAGIAGHAMWLTVVAAASLVGLPATASAAPHAPSSHETGMHGNPVAAARYWRYQQQDYDCAEMAVADVVGQLTGRMPSEDEVTGAAEEIPSVAHPGPIYKPSGKTRNQDVPVLLAHYGVQSDIVHSTVDTLTQDLDRGQKIIVGINDKTLWNKSGDRSVENHFVVVTGIDTKANVVHVNDSGIKAGRDEQVSLATFQAAWRASDNFAVVTR
jgi:Peptidase_C39 like family